MKRPLVLFVLSFCAGIAAASLIMVSLAAVFSTAAIFLVLSFLSQKRALRFKILIFFSAFFLGAVLLKNYLILPKCHLLRYVHPGGDNLYALKGTIDSDPLFKFNSTSFVFKAEKLQFGNLEYDTCGKLLVRIAGIKDLYYGDQLNITGKLHYPRGHFSRKPVNYRDSLYNQGIYFIMRIKTDAGVVQLGKNKGLMLKKLALWLKARMKSMISKYTSPVTANIVDAMILGEQAGVPKAIYNSMVRAGTVHILVVSGFNVGLVTFIIILLLRLIRFPRRARFCIAIPVLVVYCLITGASNPVVRSTVMAVFFMIGCLIRREPDIYNSLSMALIFILAINPLQLFEIGFQLSFASVLSITYLYPKIKSLFRIERLKIRCFRFLLDSGLISLSAWFGTMGIIAYYFRIFSPITVLANIFIVPLAAFITLCGLSLIFAGLICPPAAPLFASNCELLAAFLVGINEALVKIPGATFRL